MNGSKRAVKEERTTGFFVIDDLGFHHDDRYFDLADRIIKLDYGRLDSTPFEPVQTDATLEILKG